MFLHGEETIRFFVEKVGLGSPKGSQIEVQTSNIKQTGQQTKFYSTYPLCHGSTVPLGQRRCAECQILTITFTCSLGREAHEFAMPPSLDVRFVGVFPPYLPADPSLTFGTFICRCMVFIGLRWFWRSGCNSRIVFGALAPDPETA